MYTLLPFAVLCVFRAYYPLFVLFSQFIILGVPICICIYFFPLSICIFFVQIINASFLTINKKIYRAALDSKSEKTVVDALQRVMQKGARSMVMVTHRLGVIRSVNVNKVIVLEKGEIAEVGHPEELLQNKDGLYSQLAREQGIVAESSSLSSEIMSSHSSATTTTTTTLVNGDVNGSVDGGGGRLEHDVEMKDIPTPLAQC
uniref:ABC transporter domain-containing protein n=1 Tax=Ditylum brightwellii TaxID=49249 RepID=A0A7S4SH25_9STRA